MTLLLVAVGSAFGAVARYLVDFRVVSRGIIRVPAGTIIVNVSGSCGIGLLVGILGSAGGPEWITTLLGAGFLAAYTTFSAWMFESARLIQRGAYAAASIHLMITVLGGLIAAIVGLVLGAGAGRLL